MGKHMNRILLLSMIGGSVFLSWCMLSKQQPIEDLETPSPVTSSAWIVVAWPTWTTIAMRIPVLPTWLSEDEFSIQHVPPRALWLDEDDVWVRWFELLPDGAVFDEPVEISFPYEWVRPIYMHIHDGKREQIAWVRYEMSETWGVAHVPLNSFSFVIEWQNWHDVMDVEFSASDSRVGESVPFTVKYTLRDSPPGERGWIVHVKPWTATIKWSLRTEGAVRSSKTLQVPPETAVSSTYTLQWGDLVTCYKEWKWKITHQTVLSFEAKLTYPWGWTLWTDLVIEQWPWLEFLHVSTEVECKPKRKSLIPPAKCGDGYANQKSEDCDGKDMRGKSCRDFGFEVGLLRCTEYCEYDKRDCEDPIQWISCNNNTWESYNEYTEWWLYGKQCSTDCPSWQKCDTKTCTCVSWQEWSEKTYGKVDLDRFLNPDKYPPVPKTKKVKAIKYWLSYIPVDQLFKTTGEECEKQEHWHADGEVTMLNGMKTTDPAPTGCWFWETSKVPVEEIEVPLTQEEIHEIIRKQDEAIRKQEEAKKLEEDNIPLPGMEDDEEDGGMVRAEIPRVVIPAR